MKIARLLVLTMMLPLAACAGEPEAEPAPPPAGQEAAETGDAPPTQEGAMLDPNTASRDDLLGVPGMTEPAADALLAGRPFDDMRAVDAALAAHMDSTARTNAYAVLWKPIDLNRATAEEIELIPGVGPRMRHEFEEYRPYDSMARFRREIGKYVNDAEVARLERYVTLNP